MSTDRYHKGAKDGKIEVLKDATRRDCNGKDEQGMTPTLYAAFHGHLEALRLLCGRGGEPDKADIFGNTALHLAAAQGHKHIVTFLVNFGANIYAVDLDGRTPRELAGMNNRDDILRYLDGVEAKYEASDKKKAKAMKEKAQEDAKKRFKEYQKRKEKTEKKQVKLEKRQAPSARPSVIETLKFRIKSGSMTNLNGTQTQSRNSFSALVSGGTMTGTRNIGTVQRKILANKNNRLGQTDDDFKVSEIEDGKRSVRSLKGYRRDSEVLYGGTLETSRRKRISSLFNEAEYIEEEDTPPPSGTLTRSLSQPDFLQEMHKNGGDVKRQETSGIFIRPGMGSIVIRKSISNNMHGFYSGFGNEESSVGSGESYGPRGTTDDELTDSDSDSDDNDNPNGPLERFLTAFGLQEYLSRFEEQKIDLQTLMILTEDDLKSLNLPLGPHRKLVTAVNERKAALENPGEVTDSML